MPRKKGYEQFLSSKLAEGPGVSASEDHLTSNEDAPSPTQSPSNPVSRLLKKEGKKQRTFSAPANRNRIPLHQEEDYSSPSLFDENLVDELANALEKTRVKSQPDLSDAPSSTSRAPFKAPSAVGRRAVITAERLRDTITGAQRDLHMLSKNSVSELIYTTLDNVERHLAYVSKKIKEIHHPDADGQVRAITQEIEGLEQVLCTWRRDYPDNFSPIKIDNSKLFVNTIDKWNTPTLIAYTIALVSRVFEGVARRGSSALLKLLKIYGLSITLLTGGPSLQQTKALEDIPESIETLETRLNMDVPSIPHAVCPCCSYTHPPMYPKNSRTPLYPTHCTERITQDSEPCGAELLFDSKPIKTYHYYSFYEWFGRFIAHPGIEQYGDKFCDDVSATVEVPEVRRDFKDGTFVRSFKGHDGKLYITERGEEGRWLFLLFADFFNVEGNSLHGKTSSTGVTGLVCLNLPPAMRNNQAWVYIPGIIQGRQEPDAKQSEHRHYWRLLVTEFEAGYSRGLRPFHTHTTHQMGLDSNKRIFRVAIAGASMDFKAARPFGGFLDVTSHHTCFLCKCWHLTHIGRTDFENWRPADIAFLKKGTQEWLTAPTIAQRKQIENFYGTRSSELWRLPYWKPTLQLLIEPMHTLFLILEQRFARRALGLDNPEPDGIALDEPEQGNLKRKKAKSSKKKLAYISFYHEFTPPPHPSDLTPLGMGTETGRTSDALRELFDEPEVQDQRLSLLEWNDLTPEQNSARLSRNEQFVSTIQGDPRAFQAVYDLYQSLSSPAPVKEAEKQKFLKKLSSYRWIVLAFVCNNLVEFPTPKHGGEGENEKKVNGLLSRSSLHKGDVTVKMFAQALAHWRLHKVESDRFKWPHFIPKDKQLPSIPWLHLHGKFGKSDLVQHLVEWRMNKPLERLVPVKIDSTYVLQRLQQAVREVITPSWVTRPPEEVGLKRAGTLKADHWRTLFSIHLPLALISIWDEDSPSAADNASKMAPVLQTSMHLTCASIAMTRNNLSLECRNLFRESIRAHIEGLKLNFPGFMLPSHHLSFHIFDFMDSFSNVRNWWAFPFETLIGKMQRISTNHKIGELELTILESICKNATFRRWMMLPDCPELVKFCRNLLDKAYGYDKRNELAQNDADDLQGANPKEVLEYSANPTARRQVTIKFPMDIAKKIGNLNPICFSQVPAPKGFYGTPALQPVGNSYVCYRPPKNSSREASLMGQIRYIFEHGGTTNMAILIQFWDMQQDGNLLRSMQ
ncbi:serine threonine protein kinase [Lentinula edodes]|uniref:Serine threonine protein kinase n=1 Tax=Lentinula edodes TaxID=5353 RepID=A0A1Q3E5X2_LENED|nr:serine threonine protein kinase [Lentinula edodes]